MALRMDSRCATGTACPAGCLFVEAAGSQQSRSAHRFASVLLDPTLPWSDLPNHLRAGYSSHNTGPGCR